MEREKKRVQEKMEREKKKDEVAQQKAAEKLRQLHEREAKKAAERAEKEKRAEERKRLQDEKRRFVSCHLFSHMHHVTHAYLRPVRDYRLYAPAVANAMHATAQNDKCLQLALLTPGRRNLGLASIPGTSAEGSC